MAGQHHLAGTQLPTDPRRRCRRIPAGSGLFTLLPGELCRRAAPLPRSCRDPELAEIVRSLRQERPQASDETRALRGVDHVWRLGQTRCLTRFPSLLGTERHEGFIAESFVGRHCIQRSVACVDVSDVLWRRPNILALVGRPALAALAALLVLTPSSVAKVVPDACIAGIGLWDNSATVLRQWGKPVSKLKDPPHVWWDYRQESVLLTPWHGSRKPKDMIVRVIRTQDPSERLPSGIGFGSSAQVARTRYPHCSRQKPTCDIGKTVGRDTTLWFSNGRVSRVSMSLDSTFIDGPRQQPDPRCSRS